MSSETIIGIDLGTTNSAVAIWEAGTARILEEEGVPLLPSCVGLTPGDELLVGTPARNQLVLYPERTIQSIKRQMGSSDPVTLGDRTLTPQEVSALLLKTLAARASRILRKEITRAVITVPAYFSNAQRQATREAGKLAGLEVVRLLQEPTAAALAYGGEGQCRMVMVYDLGGGTFDVSIVRLDRQITEVLASHGDAQLGGDDLDRALLDLLADAFEAQHGQDARKEPRARARLLRAAESARCQLSTEENTVVREESLMTKRKRPLHLEYELSRKELEVRIRPFILRTLDSVHRAMKDANVVVADLDEIVLAGGATRTPLVHQLLTDMLGQAPKQELHPDLCVAQGAAILAGRLEGQDTQQILVDVTPYSFGPATVGMHRGDIYPYSFSPVIHRNTPLPASEIRTFYTSYDNQDAWSVEIFQGENKDALQNLLIGQFMAQNFSPQPEGSPILCKMDLDPDGILHVTVTEKKTGQSKRVTIENAMATLEGEALSSAQARLNDLVDSNSLLSWSRAMMEASDGSLEAVDSPEEGREGDLESEEEESLMPQYEEEDGQPDADDDEEDTVSPVLTVIPGGKDAREADHELRGRFMAAQALVERCQGVMERMHPEDREDASALTLTIERALEEKAVAKLDEATNELSDLLFYVEAR